MFCNFFFIEFSLIFFNFLLKQICKMLNAGGNANAFSVRFSLILAKFEFFSAFLCVFFGDFVFF